jgi:hypothetical protein
MNHRITSAAILLPLLLSACSSTPTVTVKPASDLSAIKDLPILSPWSIPLSGLRCRIAIDREDAMETTALRGAFLLENTSEAEITLTQPAHGQGLVWTANQEALPVNTRASSADAAVEIRLAPHSTQVFGPWNILVPPGKPTCILSATLHAGDRSLTSPSLMIHVTPADWGQSSDGLRLRLSAPKLSYTVGEPLDFRLFLHNTTAQPLAVYDLDWESLDSYVKQDRTTYTVKTGEDKQSTIPPGLYVSRSFPEPPPLAPGHYRIRINLDSPELSIDHAPAWHGKLASNEISIEIVAK